jgi:hypothetical protein
MTDALVIGIAAPTAAIIGAGLSFLATRARDVPAAEVAREKAALDAWAEFATSVRDELQLVRGELRAAEGRIQLLRGSLDECLERQRRGGS